MAIESMRHEYDEKFDIIFQAINRMITAETKKKPIGFIWPEDKQD